MIYSAPPGYSGGFAVGPGCCRIISPYTRLLLLQPLHQSFFKQDAGSLNIWSSSYVYTEREKHYLTLDIKVVGEYIFIY